MRVAVYTIALNEEKQVEGWWEANRDADYLCVTDTGSTDGTVRALHGRGVRVRECSVSPWRFDVARNVSLAVIPQGVDLCICVDMDERLAPGWRPALEALWEEARADGQLLERVYHPYIWDWKLDGTPNLTYRMERVHHRNGFLWKYPCHEGLYPYPPGRDVVTAYCPGLVIEHHADYAKPRAYYWLCHLSYLENPGYARPAFYWGRELYHNGQYEEAINVLSGYWALRGSGDHEHNSVVLMLWDCFEQLHAEPPAWLVAMKGQVGRAMEYLGPPASLPALQPAGGA